MIEVRFIDCLLACTLDWGRLAVVGRSIDQSNECRTDQSIEIWPSDFNALAAAVAAAGPRAFTSAAVAVRAASGDGNEEGSGRGSGSGGGAKKKRRKVPLPAELLEEQQNGAAAAAVDVNDSAAASSSAARSREDQLAERLKQDIARFKAVEKAEAKLAPEEEASGLAGLGQKAASAFDKVLVADFFVVVAFFGWFVAGVVFKSVFDDRTVLDGFNAIWTPVIQPALGMYVRTHGGVSQLWGCECVVFVGHLRMRQVQST
jgi:hypothetical protein